MRVGVVLSTYNQPEYLRLAIEGYHLQTRRPDRVLVADDGSGPATAEVVSQAARETGIPILHLWHPDRGFRKNEILNRAVAVADEDLLIFSDGDCIPGRNLVQEHLALTREDRFVSGGYLKLTPRASAAVTLDAVQDGRVFSLAWLRSRGWRPGRRVLRFVPAGRMPKVLDAITPTAATWNGHNASILRRHLLAVNGFDLEMGYGGQDRALGERLENAGISGLQARYRLPVIHLHHERPYEAQEDASRNRELRARIRSQGETRARRGLAELEPSAEVRIRAFPSRSYRG
jgi:glycosyltransferase involved in cell wall biosynthesis